MLLGGDRREVVIEDQSHLSRDVVRGVALTPTRGMARNAVILDTGLPLPAPVGKGVLGGVFNVFGETIDRLPPPQHIRWTSIHADPVPLGD